jgi:hypothetical protein
MGTKLSTPREALGPCGAIAGGPKDPTRHLFQVEATIKPITEGAEVAISVLFKIENVERSANAGF